MLDLTLHMQQLPLSRRGDELLLLIHRTLKDHLRRGYKFEVDEAIKAAVMVVDTSV